MALSNRFALIRVGLSILLTISGGLAFSQQDQGDVAAVPAQAAIAAAAAATEVVQVELAVNDVAADPASSNNRLESIVRIEVALLSRLFKLSDEQQKSLAKLDKDWITAQAKPGRNVGMNFIGNMLGGGNISQVASPQDQLRRALKGELAKILTTEQNEQYAAEIKRREEFTAETKAFCLVTLLEERVYLTSEQRPKLAAEIAKWRGIKDLYIAFYMQNANYLPNIPRSVMNKVLTKQQLDVVGSFQTVEISRDQFEDGEPVIMIAR